MTTKTKPTKSASIRLDQIDRSRNHRIAQPHDEAKIAALMQSIQATGQLQPVRVYERGPEQAGGSGGETPYILGFGARRCAAIERLGWAEVEAIVFPPASDAEIEAARGVENLHRQDITPMEEVLAVKHMLDACTSMAFLRAHPGVDDPHAYVASQLARSVQWVRDRDYLHRLAPRVQELALRTQLPAGHLREIAKVGDPQLQFEIACEAAGTASWYFDKSADTLQPKAGHGREQFEDLLRRTAEGSHHRLGLKQVEAKVAAAQRSLRSVPWEYALPVAVPGKGIEIRACSGCPHNSETDHTLFGVEEDSGNPRGLCLDPGCFAAKTDAVDQAKAGLLKAFGRRKTPPAAAEVDARTPAWLKASTARGYVQREVKKRAGGQAPGGAKASARQAPGRRELTPHEKALQAFGEAMGRWLVAASETVFREARALPMRWAGLCVLVHTKAFSDQEQWHIPYVSSWCSPTTGEPTQPKPPSKALLAALALHRAGDLDNLAALDVSTSDEWTFRFEHYADPAVLASIAEGFGLQLDPAPTWDDFKPQPEPEPAAERALKKLPAKKKAVKKKPAAKKKGGAS